jgi:hypothetical protein
MTRTRSPTAQETFIVEPNVVERIHPKEKKEPETKASTLRDSCSGWFFNHPQSA